MTARPPRAPWTTTWTSGEVRLMEAEVTQLRAALRRPPRDESDGQVRDERRALSTRVGKLEDERLALATRRESLRRDFDAAARAAHRRDGRLRALGHLVGLAAAVGLGFLAADVLSASPPEADVAGWMGLGLLALATLGLAVRARRRPAAR